MKPSTPLFVTSLALLAPPAAAEEQHHASLWIEARPWTCSNLVAPLAQEIALACDAAEKACSIAQSAESADRRIVLRCKEGDGRWVLDAETKGGEHLWSLDLTGDEDERLRRAAMWAAHIDSDAPPPATSAPTPHASAPSPSPRPARDAAPAAVPETSATGHGGIALSAHGAYETSTEGVPLAGARGVGAIRVAGRTHVVLALDGVRQVDPGAPPFSLFRAGLGAAWGAPFSDDVLGAGVEVGAAAAESFRFGGVLGGPYGAVNVTAQYPTATLRPFATAGLAVFSLKPDWSSTGLLGPVFSLDLGLAWSAW